MTKVLGWIHLLDDVDRESFLADLEAAVAKRDVEGIEECLRQWRLTAESLTNAELRDRLLED